MVDLARDAGAVPIGPGVERVQVSLLWGVTAIGELVTGGRDRARIELELPDDVLRTAAELDRPTGCARCSRRRPISR